ncbi:MAG TPA: SDR family NAD(P)-dependent oxidoreductase, partial [Solirubrobacteraceae bacterium]|nr:SDR family NAD(P)-dependent oxidoreductase [Solirubrobacteraceae bacterium]
VGSLEGLAGRVSFAAVNGPSSTVVSGDEGAVLELAGAWEGRGVRVRRLRVSHAFHSPLMDGMLEEFAEVAGGVSFAEPGIPVVSNVTGGVAGGELCEPRYWVRHVREPVRFSAGVRCLYERGARRFLELGPDGVLSGMVEECVEGLLAEGRDGGGVAGEGSGTGGSSEGPVLAVSVLRKRRPEVGAFLGALAELWVRGTDVDWGRAFAGGGAARVALPTYAFQRERYWLARGANGGDPASIGQSSAGHPLLGAAVAMADDRGLIFTGRLSLESHLWLEDHAVLGTVLLAGTAFVELALHAGAQIGCPAVRELTLEAPLVLGKGDAVQLQVAVGEPDESGGRPVGIYSRLADTEDTLYDAEWTRHAGGTLTPADTGEAVASERAALLRGEPWPPAGAEAVAVDDLYDRLLERGLEYGPVFQGLHAAWRRGSEVFAEVSLDEQESERAGSFGVHPALLDGALHTMGVVLLEGDDGEGGERRNGDSANSGGQGAGGVRLPFAFGEVELYAAGASSLRVCLFAAGDDAVGLIVADEAGRLVASIGSLVARELPAAQLGAAARGQADDALLTLEWGPVAGSSSVLSVGECVVLEVEDGLAGVLGLVQGWLGDERSAGSRLVLVTRGAVAVKVGEGVEGLAQSPVWGLVRSAESENPGRFVLVDVDGSESPGVLDAALACGESQLAVRDGVVLAARLVGAGGGLLVPDGGGWRLAAGGERFEDLALVDDAGMAGELGVGEVRVGVRVGGLNFRDVLIALGVYPGGGSVGGEGAGVVLEVGPDVEGLRVGDRVMGLLGCLGPVSVGDHRLLAKVPEGWSFAQAASVPVAFLTAYYGLVELGCLRRGERVLVHAGTGGVGMAAVQLAKWLGAEVFATASPGKWGVLRSLGLDDAQIASSRSLEFGQRFRDVTGGQGVDVVLDSLAGEFVDVSLGLLGEGGRFVEMGKSDVRDPVEVAGDHPGVSYRAFDLMEAGPERIQEMFGVLLGLFEDETLQALPVGVCDVRRAPEVFRFMSQARHTGKLALSVPRGIDPGGTVLITGGTGTLGGVVARHLVTEHGVRRLLLVSRSGEDAEGAGVLRAELEGLGASVTFTACDVSDHDALKALLDSIPGEFPLCGVVHAAGTVDDGLVGSLTPERLDGVFGAKADAAWYLHELTEDLDLGLFVLFSSAAGTLGSPGQAGYAAANAFLDALAGYRRARGLVGVSIAWGLWEQASGITGALSAADRARLGRSGLGALSSERALGLLDAAIAGSDPFVFAAPLDRGVLRAHARQGTLPGLLAGLVRVPARRVGEQAGSLARRLAAAPVDEREGIVLGLVLAQAAAVLGHASPDALDAQRSFKDTGFDSLSAVELRNRLNTITGLRLPATLVFDYPTPAATAQYL